MQSPRPPLFASLQLRNTRCFKETEVPLDPRMTVIIGGNGAGKTTIVESLASLTYGDDEGLREFPLRRKTSGGEVALFEKGAKTPIARWTNRSRTRLPQDRYLFAYGRYRRVFNPDAEQFPSRDDLETLVAHSSRDRATTLRLPDNNLFADLSRYLTTLHGAIKSDPRLGTVWERLNVSLQNLGTGISEIRVISGKYNMVPVVVRKGLELELRELSDGYQAFLVIVFDLLLRYPYLFPQLEDPLSGNALVVVDEVDLHLHPRWQRTVIRQLMELFPNTQFVLTTHSPAVLQGAIDMDDASVVVLEENAAETEVVARKLSPKLTRSLRGAEIGSLLVEETLFSVPSRYSPEMGDVETTVDALQAKVASGDATDDDLAELSKHLQGFQKLVAEEDARRADTSHVSKISGLQEEFAQSLLRELRSLKGAEPNEKA